MLDGMIFELSKAQLGEKALSQRVTLLYEPVLRVSEAFYADFFDESQSETKLRYAQLYFSRELHLQFAALCYRMIDSEHRQNLGLKAWLSMAALTVGAYGYAMLRSYQLSLILPSQIWEQLFDIYNYMASLEPGLVESKLDISKTPHQRSLKSLLTSCLLFTTIVPYQLNVRELEKAFYFIMTNVEKVNVHDDVDKKYEFIFSALRGTLPEHRHFFCKQAGDYHFIDTGLLIKYLNHTQGAGALGEPLVKKLNRAWRQPQGRGSERVEEESEFIMTSSMSAMHRQLVGTTSAPLQAHLDESEPTVIVSNKDGGDCPKQQIIDYFESVQSATSYAQPHHQEQSLWRSVNRSDNGIKLCSQIDVPNSHIACGLFVGLKDETKKSWYSAFIRWVSIDPKQGVSIGVQLISEENRPIYVQNARQRRHGYRAAGFIADNGLLPYAKTVLVTPALPYKIGDQLYLSDDKKESEIKLLECLEQTEHCKIFSYQSL